MKCPDRTRLAAFLNESLSPDEAEELGRHIDDCLKCQAQLEGLVPSEPVTPTHDPEDDLVTLTAADQSAVIELIRRMHAMENRPEVITDGNWRSFIRSPDSAPDYELPFRLDRYTLTELVGEGATGRLYRAVDEQLGRQVAVKILKPELAAIPSARIRFEREARACAALRHDHIVAIHHVETDRQGVPPYLVMEFINGCSVADWSSSANDGDPRPRVECVRQAALALQAAHDAGIVHRDIKPSNLLIDESSGRLRVADFGLARLAEAEESLTTDDAIAGTPAYMSPEQITNPRTVTGRSDVYSLGVVLYELLTGERPFRGTIRMVLQQVQHEEPIPPRRLNDRVPRDLETVCLKAMAKEDRFRYPSAQEFADDLQRWLNGRAVLARPVGSFGRLWRWCRRNPRAAGATIIVAAVLVAGAVDWSRYRRGGVTDQLRREWKADDARRDQMLVESSQRERDAERRWQLALQVIREAFPGDMEFAETPTDASKPGGSSAGLDRALGDLTDEIMSVVAEEPSPSASWAALQLSEIWMRRGDSAVRHERHAAAAEHYGQALDILNGQLDSVDASSVHTERAVLTLKLAGALNRTGDERALTTCVEACRLLEELADGDDSAVSVRLAEACGELATCHLQRADMKAAIAAAVRQSELLAEVANVRTGNFAVLNASGQSKLRLAKLHGQSEDWTAAVQTAGSAALVLREICDLPSSEAEHHLLLSEAELFQVSAALAIGDATTQQVDSLKQIQGRIQEITLREDLDSGNRAIANSLLGQCRDLMEAAATAE